MSEARPVLLTVSGFIPEELEDDVEAARRPRADYVVMAEAFDADVADVAIARRETGRLGHIIERATGVGGLLGWYCFVNRKRYDAIVTDGEQVGIPLALLCRLMGRKSATHVMVCHVLSTRAKRLLLRTARLAGMIDRYVMYSSWQAEFARTELRIPEDRIVLTSFMVDTDFFDTDRTDGLVPIDPTVNPRPMICSAGLERRDYQTLIAAVDGLAIDVIIAAGSKWSKRSFDATGTVPDNVLVKRFDELTGLRAAYGRARFVVMPLEDVDFQAGITTILEAMSMGLPVICTQTRGQTDTIIEAETGRYVSVGDVDGLRRAIVDLIENETETRAMGARARSWAVDNADVHVYAERLAGVVRTAQAAISSQLQ